MATRKRKRRISGPVFDYIREQRLAGWTPAMIHKELRKRGDEIDPRTVQRTVSDLTPRDSTEAWSVANADLDDAELVLDVFGELALDTEGRVWLTEREAGWVVRVRRVAPTLSARRTHEIAQAYMLRDDHKEDSADIDIWLALRTPETRAQGAALEHAALHARLWSSREFRPLTHDPEVVKRWAEFVGFDGRVVAHMVRVARQIESEAEPEPTYFPNISAQEIDVRAAAPLDEFIRDKESQQ